MFNSTTFRDCLNSIDWIQRKSFGKKICCYLNFPFIFVHTKFKFFNRKYTAYGVVYCAGDTETRGRGVYHYNTMGPCHVASWDTFPVHHGTEIPRMWTGPKTLPSLLLSTWAVTRQERHNLKRMDRFIAQMVQHGWMTSWLDLAFLFTKWETIVLNITNWRPC